MACIREPFSDPQAIVGGQNGLVLKVHYWTGLAVAQGLDGHEFHKEEPEALRFADLVDGYDAGTVEAGSGLRFPFKTAQGMEIFQRRVSQSALWAALLAEIDRRACRRRVDRNFSIETMVDGTSG